MSELDGKNGTRRLGWGMTIGGWVLLVGLLTLLFQDQLERVNNPNRSLQTTEDSQGVRQVVLNGNRAGHYLATGSINGHEVAFLLDTGATDVAVPKKLADKIGLKQGVAFTSRTANGSVTAWRTTLDSVSIGGIEVESVRASILPTLADGEVLLGMSFLKQLEMIQRGGTLTLRQY